MAQEPGYFGAFEFAKLTRESGVLEVRFHTDGGPLQWTLAPHRELPKIFRAISEDVDNRVVILTGTGDVYTGPRVTSAPESHAHTAVHSPEQWDECVFDGRRLEHDLLNIEVPVIAAINGPVWRHMELPLMSDIVLASDTAWFEDRAHFASGNLVPGDGIHLVCATLMGWNRARYMQLMGHAFSAHEAKEWGLVNEVLPQEAVLRRGWEIAEMLTKKPVLLLRYTRLVFTQEMKRRMLDHVPLGLAVEGLAMLGETQHHGLDSQDPAREPVGPGTSA